VHESALTQEEKEKISVHESALAQEEKDKDED
jgi:hypothetical protein